MSVSGLQVDVVLRGYSGYNTRWALKVLDRVFPVAESGGSDGAVPPLAVTVFFGANDACLPDRYAAFQHVPLDEYKQNLHSFVSSFKVPIHPFTSVSLSIVSKLQICYHIKRVNVLTIDSVLDF